jgi:hypothetical protein
MMSCQPCRLGKRSLDDGSNTMKAIRGAEEIIGLSYRLALG